MILLKKTKAMNRRLITALTVCVLTAGTLHACHDNDSTDYIQLPADAISSAAKIDGDTVCVFPERTFSARITDNDRIITVSANDNKLVNVIDRRTGDTLFSTLSYGAGEGMFLLPFPRYCPDTLIIMDGPKKQLVFYNLDSLAALSSGPEEIITPGGIQRATVFPTILPYRGRLLALNPYCFRSPDGMIDNHDDRRFILSDSTMTFPELEFKYMTINVAQGNVIAVPDAGKIAYIPPYESHIEIYDYNTLKKLIDISLPIDFANEYWTTSDGLVLVQTKAPGLPDGFLDGNGCKEWFLCMLTYQGITYMLKLDWNGNLMSSYRFEKGERPSDISLSDDGKHIYLLHDMRILMQYSL